MPQTGLPQISHPELHFYLKTGNLFVVYVDEIISLIKEYQIKIIDTSVFLNDTKKVVIIMACQLPSLKEWQCQLYYTKWMICSSGY